MTNNNTPPQPVAVLEGHTDRAWQVCWHPTTSPILTLASCSGDRSIRIWKRTSIATTTNLGTTGTDTWECVNVIDNAHKRAIRSVAYSPSGDLLTSAGFDATTAVWDRSAMSDVECVATLEGHENEVKGVAWSASGSLLATCSRDKTVWIWEYIGDHDFECMSVLQEHTQDVKAVVWHPVEEILASASYDDTIRIWAEDEDDWYCADVLQGHTSTVWSIDFNGSGDRLVSCSDDKTVRIWKTVPTTTESRFNNLSGVKRKGLKWECIKVLEGLHTRTIYSVSWSKQHGLIATAGGDNSIRVFKYDEETDTLSHVTELVSSHGHFDVNCVRWCNLAGSSNLLASTGDDAKIKIWSVTS